MSAESRRAALHRFMSERGLRPFPWAKRAGIREGTLRAFLKGDSNAMRHDTLEKLARAADVSVAELIGERPSTIRAGRDTVAVQILSVQAGMGGGMEVSEESAGEPFYFRRGFLERVTRGVPARLRIIELKGDSMEPTLSDGDIALVDLTATDVANAPGVYCLWNGQGVVVKRVQTVPGQRPMLRIRSDNPIYGADEVAADEVRIIGRVVWRGGGI